MNKIPKEYLQIINPFINSGELKIEQGSKHAKLVRSDGRTFPVPSSPSDHRAILNFKSQVRRFSMGQQVFR